MACCACPPPPSNQRFRRVLWAALAANAAMFAIELIASLHSGSMALQADALDFLGDSFNYAVSLLVLGSSLRARAGAALLKSATMAGFGTWVLASTAQRLLSGAPPDAALMGWVGILALATNVAVAVALFRYRGGDSNRRSIWLCSRNDALANVAVLLAAGGVAVTAASWPDLLVAGLIAGLCLHSAASVYRQARGELRLHRIGGAPSASPSGATTGAG